MNNIWGDKIISNNLSKFMKIVFANNAEKEKVTSIVMNASSISNSQSLMSLVKDAVVDGSEPEPEAPKETAPSGPVQEPMSALIERAEAMGVRVSKEDSRAGILAKIKEMETPTEPEPEPEIETKDNVDLPDDEDKEDEEV